MSVPRCVSAACAGLIVLVGAGCAGVEVQSPAAVTAVTEPKPTGPTPAPSPTQPAPTAGPVAQSGFLEVGPVATTPHADGEWQDLACARMCEDIDFAKDDYRGYCTPGNLMALGVGIGAAAPLANTPADRSVRDWYQRRIRSETTDEFANFTNYAGQLWLVLPVGMEAAAWLGKADDGYQTDGGMYEWSNRSLRSILVGVPPMLVMYAALGSHRPDRDDSRWHPFEDVHGVSGHTFMGAVPFLTAAAMTDNDLLKGALIAGSFATGWARMDLDRHYLSQIALGWWMAYLAVRSVDRTQEERRTLLISPTFSDGVGVSLQLRY